MYKSAKMIHNQGKSAKMIHGFQPDKPEFIGFFHRSQCARFRYALKAGILS